MRLTPRGFAVLIGAVCLYALGELAGYAFFRVLGGAAAGGVLAAVAVTMVRPRAEVSRTVHPDRVERGKPALASLVVRNPTERRHGGFTAGDRVGAEVRKIQVRPLAPGAEATYHYELPTEARGRLQVGPLELNRFDPFDLVRNNQTLGSTATVWVYPRRHPVRPAQVGHARHDYDGPITDPPLRGSSDLRAVREYVIGDEVRFLHWKATAKTGQLMVREYVDPAQMRCTVVLDTRPDAMGAAVFEEAVEVAASVLYASAVAGQLCRLITPAGTDVPAGSGARAARALLDELCLVGQDATNDAPLVPPRLATARPSGALVLITGPAAELGSAGRWRPDTVIRLGMPGQGSLDNAGLILARDAVDAAAKWNLGNR
ncbi:DUF58 domain-containing protein [Actinocrispum wychmicini]|uniref:Uncharacterized protein (DUF58 family) n=1 Tax=Actinocrispum wychmicini TaxID=1213861 RepID=A0A4V2S675_9PSEU|nr:DUF58 domain-containing protein [Actinocrispum wychmicini]TCO54770.1 uncharacterized protein (DUF58 family) [Actinocrispum wychmicini]